MTKRLTHSEILSNAFRKMGRLGGLARKAKLSKAELSAIGKKAAIARWSKVRATEKAV